MNIATEIEKIWKAINASGGKGAKGDQGAKGNKGDPGAKGNKGDPGAQGDPGKDKN